MAVGREQSMNSNWMMTIAVVMLAAWPAVAQDARAALISRAKSFELDTPYVPPPGDPLSHHTAGYAKIMCSAVFITGLDPEFAAENVGYFTSPHAERAKVGKPVIDRQNKTVQIKLPNGVTRTAKYLGDQGCVTLPLGKNSVNFTPHSVKSALPDASKQPWPMGDVLSKDPLPPGLDMAKVQRAIDAAFEPAEAMTAAVVVTWKGRLIGERYGQGITAQTPLEGWSMGKSLTATLLGVLMQQGVYTLTQPAPIPEWNTAGDPRAKIRIADILNMSSGLRIMIRLAVEKRGEDYLSFPRKALFDKIGVRTMVMETDPFGNFLGQGYELASARDWARLGNLYLQRGVWNGERILPEDFVKFVSTLAPAWQADQRPVYGGFFWINGDGTFPVSKDVYYMNGAGGQRTVIIPSHDLVVVRLGHFKGEALAMKGLRNTLALLMEAVPGGK